MAFCSERSGPIHRLRPKHLLRAIGTAAAALVAFVAPAWAHGSGGVCTETAQEVLKSCLTGAQSDFQLARAKCDNLSNASDRRACDALANRDKSDAEDLCGAQHASRLEVCAALGEAPYDPVIRPDDFTSDIDNRFFPLEPGTTYVYEGQTADGQPERDVFEVTHQTRVILGVTCVVVQDSNFVSGALTERTLDYFAQNRDGTVWYFGENATTIENGIVVSTEGSWIAGEDGAKPGTIMEAHPRVGDVYRQEFALDVAEDIGQVQALNLSVTVPAGSFSHCLETKEFSPLEPDVIEHKTYAPGIGNLSTVESTGEHLELVRVTHH